MKKIYFTLMIAFAFTWGAKASTYMVNVANNIFDPDNFTVNVGDTVMWMWVNGNHTTTSVNIPLGATPWDIIINQNNTSYMYVVPMQGIYDYQCTYHVSMGMIGHFTALESSGINEGTAGINLDVYANPVSKELQVDLKTTKSGMMNLSLNDITGREVKLLASAQQSAGEHHFQYSVAGLSKGLYLLKLSISDGDVIRKIIIQ